MNYSTDKGILWVLGFVGMGLFLNLAVYTVDVVEAGSHIKFSNEAHQRFPAGGNTNLIIVTKRENRTFYDGHGRQLSPILSEEPSGAKVYDADLQFLGLLVDTAFWEGSNVKIFIPSLNVVTIIEEVPGTGKGDLIRLGGNVFFKNGNCSGPAFISPFMNSTHLLYRLGDTHQTRRYFFGIAPREKRFTISSKMDSKGRCSRWVNARYFHSQDGFRSVEIPPEAIPFKLPVALPIRIAR
jgi:hypothetical protein